MSRTGVVNLCAITVVWLVLIALVNPSGDFPLNDDWIFGGAAKSVAMTGQFRIPGPTAPNIILQVYWGALFCLPFDFSYLALRVSTLVGGLGLFYALIREVGGTSRMALLGAVLLAVNPLYLVLANSFMTDVPSTTLILAAIYLIVRGMRRPSLLCLVSGELVAIAGIFDRQFAMAVLLAFAVVNAIRCRFRPLAVAAGVIPLGLGVVLHMAYQHWLVVSGRGPKVELSDLWSALPHSFSGLTGLVARDSLNAAAYIGLFVLPFLVGTNGILSSRPWFRPARTGTALGVLALVIAGLLVWQRLGLPRLGNVLAASGIGPLTVRGAYYDEPRRVVMSPAVAAAWAGATALGVAGGLATLRGILGDVWHHVVMGRYERWRHRWPFMFIAAFIVIYWAMLLLLAAVHFNALFDRYLIPLVPMVIALAVAARDRPEATDTGHEAPERRLPALAALMLLALATFSVCAAHDYFAWNRSRWLALRDLTGPDRVSPSRIDGGYEFNGSYLYDPQYEASANRSWWWVTDDEYVVTSTPLDGYAEARRYAVDRWLPLVPPDILILHRTASPSPPAGGP